MRVAVLTNILSPYRVPLFHAVAERVGELLVVCAAATEPLRLWRQEPTRGFRHRVLPGLHFSGIRWEWHPHVNWGLGKVLRQFQPEVLVVGGYDQPLYWQGLWYARRRGVPLVLWYESWEQSARIRRGIGAAVKRFFVRQATVGLAFGQHAAQWLRRLHGGELPVVVTLNTVDMEFFRQHVWAFRAEEPGFTRLRSGYPGFLLLYVGRFVPLKNVAVVLRALHLLGAPDVGLLLVGAGPQEEELRRLCHTYGLQEQVFFEGFRQPEELCRYYALADVLVFPSLRESWGLVVNEALAAGLYVVASRRVAAALELLQEGWNGELFEPEDVAGLAAILGRLKEQQEQLRERRWEISQHACREFGIEKAAERFVEALQKAYQLRRC